MATIPLPALATQPQPGPLDQYGKVLQLKSLLGQQALLPGQLQQQQQQIQSTGLENQQKQQSLTDQQAATAALKAWDGKDLNDIPGLILKNGGSANAVFGAKNQILSQKTALTKLNSDTLANTAQKNDLLLGKLQSVTSGPDQGLGQRVQQAAQDAIQQGLIDPQHAQAIQQAAQSDPATLRSQLSIIEKGLMGQKEQFSQEQTDRENQIKQQQANQEAWKSDPGTGALVNVNTGQVKTVDGAMSQQMADSKYRQVQQAKDLGQTVSPDDAAFAKAYEKQKTLVPVANFNLQNAGATGTAGKPSAIAQGLADGTMKWQDVVSARTPMAVKQALLSEVKGIKPDYNSGDFSIEQGVKQEFASGDAAKSLTAFNTAIEHAKQLSTAADALSNGNIVGLNKIGNALGYQFGSDKTTNFNVIKNALTGEISKVFKGGGATDAEIEAVQGPFSAANSPAQLKGAINNAVQLMNSKREALQQQYQQGIQAKPNFGAGAAQGGGPSSSNAAAPAHIAGGKAIGLTEGATGTGSDGRKYIVKGGIWVPQQ